MTKSSLTVKKKNNKFLASLTKLGQQKSRNFKSLLLDIIINIRLNNADLLNFYETINMIVIKKKN